MKNIYSHALEELQNYGKSLSKKAFLTGKTWVSIDEDQEIKTIIFRKNKELLISINGVMKKGKWDYLSKTKSLLLEIGDNIILCKEGFLDDAVLVLRKDGVNGIFYAFANEDLIPDLNIKRYLNSLKYKSMGLIVEKEKDGRMLEIHPVQKKSAIISIGSKVSQNLIVVADGNYLLQDSILEVEVENSYIKNIVYHHQYETRQGQIIHIEQLNSDDYEEGDKVLLYNRPAPDGKYGPKGGFAFTVKDGLIYQKKWYK